MLSGNKLFAFLFSLVFVLALAGGVFANEDSGAKLDLEELRNKRQEQIEQKKQKLEKIREQKKEAISNFKEKEASKRAEVKQKVAEKVKELLLRAVEHQAKTLERLDKIAEKIASRIDKLGEKGVNVQTTKTKLAEAESAGAAAQNAIEETKATIEAIDPSSAATPKETVESAKLALRTSKQALFNYHKALVGILRELKASKPLKEGTGAAEQ